MVGSYNKFEKAITNFEALTDWQTNMFSNQAIVAMYGEASFSASFLNKTNDAARWGGIADRMMVKKISPK